MNRLGRREYYYGKDAKCVCDPTYGQSCEYCDGTYAERRGIWKPPAAEAPAPVANTDGASAVTWPWEEMKEPHDSPNVQSQPDPPGSTPQDQLADPGDGVRPDPSGQAGPDVHPASGSAAPEPEADQSRGAR